MKRSHRFSTRLWALILLFALLFSTGCKTRANLGVDVGIHDGKVKVRPTAGIDFVGKPL